MTIGRCVHWSGVGCTYPDDLASIVSQADVPGYYDDSCPRKCGGGCMVDGLFEEVA